MMIQGYQLHSDYLQGFLRPALAIRISLPAGSSFGTANKAEPQSKRWQTLIK